jgi:purine-nucleoside phosphorylase
MKFNSLAQLTFGLDSSIYYDALVVAPSWKPTKIIKGTTFKVATLVEHSYIYGYLVEKDSLKIAWIQIASGASNLIDSLVVCVELHFKKLIFVGAVGSLNFDLHVGDLCTPS